MPTFAERNTARAKELRNRASPPEKRLWLYLKDRKLAGCKFSRQIPIGPYFADFVCRSHKLIVETDGASHDLTFEQDERRARYLRSKGYEVIRFTNREIMDSLEGVLIAIERALRSSPTPARSASAPSRQREGRVADRTSPLPQAGGAGGAAGGAGSP